MTIYVLSFPYSFLEQATSTLTWNPSNYNLVTFSNGRSAYLSNAKQDQGLL